MNDMRIELRPARPDDFSAVIALLAQAGLPTADLGPEASGRFIVAIDTTADRGAVVGAGALERYGDVGLLRSLVVAPAWRGQGVGEALVAAIEQRALDQGIGRLVLLTESAADFFRRAGFAATERAAAPDAVRASSQFASMCCASATCMEKRLDAGTVGSTQAQRAGRSA